MKERVRVSLILMLVMPAIMAGLCGCTDNMTDSGTSRIVGQVAAFYDCRSIVDRDIPDIPTNQTAVYWVYDGNGTLDLHHLNASFNCCPQIDCQVTVKSNVISVTERDVGLCDCECLSDISYQVIGLSLGVYSVRIEERYLDPDDERLEFSITLVNTPASGLVTCERTSYPWHPSL